MLKYDEVKNMAYATGTIKNDGYNGHIKDVKFGFDPESLHTLIITETSYCKSNIPRASTQAESWWLLNHHPNGRKYYNNLNLISN